LVTYAVWFFTSYAILHVADLFATTTVYKSTHNQYRVLKILLVKLPAVVIIKGGINENYTV